MEPIQQLTERLAQHPELKFSATATFVRVEAPSTDGFSVSFYSSSKGYTVHFDGWHEHFDSADEALECVAFAYSGQCRLAISYRGRVAVRWVLEFMNDGTWQAESEVGHFFVPFWLPPRVVYRQNPHLLTAA